MYYAHKSCTVRGFTVRSLSSGSRGGDGLSEVAEFAKVILQDVEKEKHVQKNGGSGARKSNNSHVERSRRITSFTLSPKHAKHTSVSLDDKRVEPARLVYDLNRILYQPMTLHPLKDLRSGVYNFKPDLEMIPPSNLESKDRFKFITPYRDNSLFMLAKKFNQKYVSSTSSMTSTLSHLHFLLSNFRPLNIVNTSISKNFPQTKCTFTKGAQFPSTIILRKLNDNIISLDSDKSLDREIILSTLGNSLEEFLTDKSNEKEEESYHFSKIDKFILRSQLDAFDPKLPGTGVFDLKTRAVAAIRHDISYVEKNDNFTGYEIDKVHGEFESLEREFFDLIKSTLLKYSLQAKIGKMDGIFVAYHNISKMFGFQYMPLNDIDYIIHSSFNSNFQRELNRRNRMLQKIHGTEEFIVKYERQERQIAEAIADAEFKMSILLLRNILVHIENLLKKRGKQSWKKLKIMMKTEIKTVSFQDPRKSEKVPVLKVIVLPLPPNFEDEKLNVKGKSNAEIMDQIESIKNENEIVLEKQKASLIGFDITVDHFYKHHQESTSLPEFAKPENGILDLNTCLYISRKYNENFYHNLHSFQNPSFFHPKDVSTWRINCHFSDIDDKNSLMKSYGSFLDEKLNSLKEQCVVRDSLVNSNHSAAIIERINRLMTSGYQHRKSDIKVEVEKAKQKDDKPTMFQNQLRAYAMKGKARSEFLNRTSSKNNTGSGEKTTWDA